MKKCSEIKENISLYIDNELEPDELKEFEEHIAFCEDCRNELNEIMQIVGLCKNTAEVELPENFKNELHLKLLEAQEQRNAEKLAFFHSRYLKLFSSIAAVFLLVFLIRGLYNFNLFTGAKSGGSTGSMNNTAAATNSQDSVKMKGIAEAPAAEAGNGLKAKNDDSAYQYAGGTDQGTQANGSEMFRASNDNRDAQLNMETSGSAAEKAAKNQTSLTIAVDDPAAQLENVRTIALESAGMEQAAMLKSDADEVKQAAVTSDTGSIELTLDIPSVQYGTFVDALNASYGQANIEPGNMATEDMTPTLEELLKQADNLDLELEKAQNANDDSKQEEIDKLKAEKAQIQDEIDNIRLGSDITVVKVILKKK